MAPATQRRGSERAKGRTGDAGETHWSQADSQGLQRPVPQQPNELDESASSQAPDSASMKKIGLLAHHDATTSVDTDRGPVLDAVYNDSVVEGHRMDDDKDVRGNGDDA